MLSSDGNQSHTTTSRQAALKQKLDAKAAEEREKEMARTEEQKKLQEKRKAKAEIIKEQKLREQRAIELQKRVSIEFFSKSMLGIRVTEKIKYRTLF